MGTEVIKYHKIPIIPKITRVNRADLILKIGIVCN